MISRASGARLWYSHLYRTARYPYITSLIEMALFVGIKQLLGRVSAARVTGTAARPQQPTLGDTNQLQSNAYKHWG